MSKILVIEDDRATRHQLGGILETEGFSVETASDGSEGLERLRGNDIDLVLLDIWMPRMTGLELLTQMNKEKLRVPALVMTSDDTPETMLKAVRRQAFGYLRKPVQAKNLIEQVQQALEAGPSLSIEVVSAKPHWVELLVPCDLTTVERIQGFMTHLDADLSEEVRESVGRVFREMLMNAVEWGGQFDPTSKVRVAYLRAQRMILYRIADPGPGFSFEELSHAAVGNPEDEPAGHVTVREQKGMRPGGFGILISQQMVDELLYNEKHNEVVFIKYLDDKG